MITDIDIFAGKFYLVFLVLNILIIGLRWRWLPREVRSLLLYLIIGLGTDLYSRWFFNQGENNLFVLHIYTILEFLSWSLFFYILFRLKEWRHGYFIWLVTVAFVLLVVNSLFAEPITGFNSNAKALVQIVLMGYAIYFFFNAFGKIDLRQPIARGHSFINFAVLLYYSGSLFIFMFSKLLFQQKVSRVDMHGIWAINAVLLVLLHLIIFIGLWTIAFRKTTSS